MFLLFKKKFHEAIRSGRKRQTIRIWKRRMLREGQAAYMPGLGRARITCVQQMRVAELTETDAVLDGFADRAALMAELAGLYGDRLADGGQCYKITFEFPVDG